MQLEEKENATEAQEPKKMIAFLVIEKNLSFYFREGWEKRWLEVNY